MRVAAYAAATGVCVEAISIAYGILGTPKKPEAGEEGGGESPGANAPRAWWMPQVKMPVANPSTTGGGKNKACATCSRSPFILKTVENLYLKGQG